MEFTTEQDNLFNIIEDPSNEKENPFSSYNITSTPSKISTDLSSNSKKEIYDSDFSNFFHDSENLRKSYYEKLNSKILLKNNEPQKRDYNSIIIFDWDDTLLCSTYLMKHSFFENENNSQTKISDLHKEKIAKLEFQVLRVLTLAISHGDVYIITNASQGWVEYSANKFFPSVSNLLSKITVISARALYGEQFPEDSRMWKIATFAKVAELYNKNVVTNLFCIGDSFIEIEAAQKMASLFKEIFLKTVKFRELPKPEQIIKQLSLVSEQFKTIHSAVRNVAITVEKNSKQKQ